jgi:hypothetical protein
MEIEMGGAGLMFFGICGFINYDIHGDIGYIIYHQKFTKYIV